ncbi:methyltransferase, FkbM family [Polaromonas sp. OV174]|uniref:FkbM family methyltransferase n=1 Tax=Polaromonas sp. OV174 TaxID=1855300 RepID=UPI0008EEF24F|nr:FkbM family methyltransferase [Polaromonas sp. OV174]SFC72962.1 methyltransferase, FkbM family [Polaromonas sp. OV174]
MDYFSPNLTKIWLLNRLYRYAMAIYPKYAFRRFGIPVTGLERLGSVYGGWFAPTHELNSKSIVYSAGIGGDITFDKALINCCSCAIHGYDPTPTAIQYISDQIANDELSPLFHFNAVGLWDSETELKFFAPKTRGWVGSYSALNLQGTEEEESILVPVKRLSTLMKENGHIHIDLLKVDIEGAEYRIIKEIIEKNIPISWLCVEFDQPVPFWTTNRTIQRLKESGFQLCKVDHWNFTFKNLNHFTTTAKE